MTQKTRKPDDKGKPNGNFGTEHSPKILDGGKKERQGRPTVCSKKIISSFEELKDLISCCQMDGVEVVGASQIFIEACRLGHIDVVSFMLESASEEYSYTGYRKGDEIVSPPAIFSSDDEDAVKMYELEIGITADSSNPRRNDALAVAVENGFVDIVSLLIKHGFDLSINNENANGQTPLMLAGYNRDLEMISLLLEEDVDVDIKDKFGSTIMSLALDSRDPVIIRKVIPYVLGHSVEEISELARIEEKEDNIDPEEQEKLDNRLADACISGDVETVRKTIKEGADVNSMDMQSERFDVYYYTPLLHAAYAGRVEIVEILLENGALMDETTSEHETALVLALSRGHEMVSRQLINAGADVNIYDWSRPTRTPLDIAKREHSEEIQHMLSDRGAKIFREIVREKGVEAGSVVKKLEGILDEATLKPISELVEMIENF